MLDNLTTFSHLALFTDNNRKKIPKTLVNSSFHTAKLGIK